CAHAVGSRTHTVRDTRPTARHGEKHVRADAAKPPAMRASSRQGSLPGDSGLAGIYRSPAYRGTARSTPVFPRQAVYEQRSTWRVYVYLLRSRPDATPGVCHRTPCLCETPKNNGGLSPPEARKRTHANAAVNATGLFM